jgi:hypothetical protein
VVLWFDVFPKVLTLHTESSDSYVSSIKDEAFRSYLELYKTMRVVPHKGISGFRRGGRETGTDMLAFFHHVRTPSCYDAMKRLSPNAEQIPMPYACISLLLKLLVLE